MRFRPPTLSLAAALVFSAVSAARGQLYLLGAAPGTDGTKATGLSADGKFATGYSQNNQTAGQPSKMLDGVS